MSVETEPKQVSVSFQGRHLLTWKDYQKAEIIHLLERAVEMKQQPLSEALAQKTLAMIFEKSSTRTRVSFEVGMTQLGGKAINLNSRDMQLGRGETIADTAQVLSRYVDGIMIRTDSHKKLEELAANGTVPIINGLCDIYHPCQALADMMTIYEQKGKLAGVKLVYAGDGNNVAHSLMIIGAILGLEVVIASPEGYEPLDFVTNDAGRLAAENGGSLTVTSDIKTAVDGADVLYTDVWTSMGQEEEETERKKALAPYQVNQELVGLAKADVSVLHCLPAHRGEEITAEVIDGSQSVVFDQAENRLHVQKAIMEALL
ncbi:ornithine carbamoyltransferase [Salimicrobium halophilum]|uniref:Ornithine carbamoyltransferase n=1 Tax=Salimicrobium halophilum TaxID=86666 RepID=A0A1G8SZF0_9BACI|nr:ornithine carbamoyltransferase [Salimicrobium halophilum]SDJ33920.1 ornithine carbamoyltransferase [Salimicrobium halophilum]